MKTAEQQARDMLERIGVEDVQSFTSGDLVELANIIADSGKRTYWKMTITDDMGIKFEALEGFTLMPGDVFYCYKDK